MEIALSVNNVVKRYGDFAAVNDVSFHVEDGKFFSILGPSGCGKSTLLKLFLFNNLETLKPISRPGEMNLSK